MSVPPNPAEQLSYEEQRAQYLDAANLIFTAAYMETGLSYNEARATAAIYEKLYSSPDRRYHTLQHPRVQLLDADMLDLVNLIHTANIPTSEVQQRVAELADAMSPDLAERLRILDRHDCLYYFPDRPGQPQTDQHKWLAQYKGTDPVITLEQMLANPPVINTTPFQFSERLLSDSPVSIGELAAICAFPNGNGGYVGGKTFGGFEKGLNEFTSAVLAITEENRIRRGGGAIALSAEEVLITCATLAATIPYERQEHLDNMARNIYAFLGQDRCAPLRDALGVNTDGELRTLVDTVVSKAGKLANRDVGNFTSTDPYTLYYGDRSVTAELLGISSQPSDPVQAFTLAYKSLDTHLPEAERIQIDPNLQGKGDGFIRTQANNGVIYHEFAAPLTNENTFAIPDTGKPGADVAHAQYFRNLDTVLPEHMRDMTFAGLQIAAALGETVPSVTDRSQITKEMALAFFQGHPSAAEATVALTQGASSIEEAFGRKSDNYHYRIEEFNTALALEGTSSRQTLTATIGSASSVVATGENLDSPSSITGIISRAPNDMFTTHTGGFRSEPVSKISPG